MQVCTSHDIALLRKYMYLEYQCDHNIAKPHWFDWEKLCHVCPVQTDNTTESLNQLLSYFIIK